jgi:aspartyl-tRNA(Asn)/glutamyl-tRNA(Gln) amidotransferase subunit A
MKKSFGAMSIAQLSVLIQSGAVDPVEVTEDVLDRIDAHADKKIFTAVFNERAIGEAKASSVRLREGRSRGPLDGVPVAWKETFST